jgi:type 1 glutamine amidotransferase
MLLEPGLTGQLELRDVQRICAVGILTLVVSAIVVAAAAMPESTRPPRILVFTKTAAFRHSSMPSALSAVRQLAERNGLAVDATEDAAAFTPSNLARYDAVVFLMTTGDALSDGQQRAFERYFRRGGGFVGVHSAADTEYGWTWYGTMLGTRFKNHPQIQRAAISVRDLRHPSTHGLPRRWIRTDEWYNFAGNPRRSVRVLATLDETTYAPGEGAMGADHPIAWSHEYQGGRAWFTGGGHTDESYREQAFRRHLLGGIRYAAGLTPPKIVSVSSSIRSRRLHISLRYATCRPCAGELSVRARRRTSRTPIRFNTGIGHARSAPLPRGRWQFSVVLRDPATGVAQSVRRRIRVS